MYIAMKIQVIESLVRSGAVWGCKGGEYQSALLQGKGTVCVLVVGVPRWFGEKTAFSQPSFVRIIWHIASTCIVVSVSISLEAQEMSLKRLITNQCSRLERRWQ